MKNALYFLIQTLGNLIILLHILRFWLPLFGADFRNPISQSILKFTSPLINRSRRFIPSFRQFDSATFIVTLALQCGLILILASLSGITLTSSTILATAIFELLLSSANIFFLAIIVSVLFSWIAPYSYSPFKGIIDNIAESLLRPYRKIFSPIGGIDLSPLLAIIAIQTVMIFLKSSAPISL